MKKVFFTSFVLLLIAYHTNAQTLNLFGVFPSYSQSGRIYKKWDYSLYLFGAINTFNQTIQEVKNPPKVFLLYSDNIIAYNFSKRFAAAVSYTYQRTDPFLNTFINENRVWQQIGYKCSIGKLQLRQRLRNDERFIQNRPITSNYYFSDRLRYLIGIEFPLKKESNYYFNAYNEFFFTLTKQRFAVYQENWAYAGIGTKTKKTGNFEIGILSVSWLRDSNKDRLNLWYLQLTWITTINISKS